MVCPSFFRTNLAASLAGDDPLMETVATRLIERLPAGRRRRSPAGSLRGVDARRFLILPDRNARLAYWTEAVGPAPLRPPDVAPGRGPASELRERARSSQDREETPPEQGVVLITGPVPVSGEEMARQFAALGYDLALCARRTDRLDALAAEITARTGRRVATAALDVTDAVAVPGSSRRSPTPSAAHRPGGRQRRASARAPPLGTGRGDANRATAMTNFVGALAQTEAALEIFRRPAAAATSSSSPPCPRCAACASP